jgi:hypothetical protein
MARLSCVLGSVLVLATCVRVTGAAEVKPPTGTPIKLPVTRDTWFSGAGDEGACNLGGAPRLKLKSYQELSLIDVDPARLRGRVINGATLFVRSTGKPHLARVTVGSFGAEWVEGTAETYRPQKGSSSFNSRRHPDVPWTVPGSDLCSVMLGQGGTTWRTADAFPPDAGGWQRIAVDPIIVAARVAGISYGFVVFDDTGSEWTRRGEVFTPHPFPNRFVHSRESAPDSAPYMVVYVGERDTDPPGKPADLRAEPGDLPAGEAWLSWTTPADAGPAGTLGFFLSVDGCELPRYLIPLAGKPGERVRMRLRDLDVKGGARVEVAVRAVDGAGNIGPAATATVTVSDRVAVELPGRPGKFRWRAADSPKFSNAEVAILDELDKVHPISGKLIPEQPARYLAANHLWNAGAQEIHLHAGRNEFVAFQILLRGTVEGVKPELTFAPGLRSVETSFGRYAHVRSKSGPLPDPIVPLRGAFAVPTPEDGIAGQQNGSLHVEVYVGHDTPAGDHTGKLTLRAGDQTLVLDVKLRVWDFTLPDSLSFIPDMNCYGLPENERDYYRLAHRHRTVLNAVPYSQRGLVHDGCAPGWDGRRLDWSAWDRRFGPYFDGTAFADLPRKGVPLECFYLPLHENWPSPMAANYNGDYWADRAFPDRYRQDFIRVSRLFAEHFNERGWHDTLFQGFLNNKVDYKQNGWSRASSPWLLDEPAHMQDFWALRWFGSAFHEGVQQAGGKAKMVFRADVSRPMWQRGVLDGLLDYNVVGGSLRSYHRMVLDRKQANGEIVIEYGAANAIAGSNMQPVGWSLDAWTLGVDGVLPWQTVGSAESWKAADDLSLFYPGRRSDGPLPSVRLKAFRRGQQDVEYLTLLQTELRQPRWTVAQAVRQALRLAGVRTGTGFTGGEDTGRIIYDRLLPQDVWRLRMQIGSALSEMHPAARRRLVELRTPPRGVLPPTAGYVSVGEVPAVAPPEPVPEAGTIVRVLQGRAAVRDALIDVAQPDRKLGGVPRDNAVRKAEQSNAFLVRFDLKRLDVPAGARVARATLSFYVWDPSSQGRTKVCAFPLKAAWDEATATWKQAAEGRPWQGERGFDVEKDAGPASRPVIVEPDMGSDTVDPPLEYQLDVTDFVRDWLSDAQPNHGVAIVPLADRSIDNGNFTRFQIYASEHPRAEFTPKLTIRFRPR